MVGRAASGAELAVSRGLRGVAEDLKMLGGDTLLTQLLTCQRRAPSVQGWAYRDLGRRDHQYRQRLCPGKVMPQLHGVEDMTCTVE
jgi:hypothetical protein